MTATENARAAWQLGWWAPVPPAVEPDELVDPAVHGALLSAVADGAPLDRLGQHRLESLKAAGLATADGRPRFPVAPAAQAKAVAEAGGDLGRALARLVAGEWSRIEVEYESVHAALASPAPGAAAFLVVGGLLLDLGVRRLLRRQGLAAPPFGSAFVWLAEGEPARLAEEAGADIVGGKDLVERVQGGFLDFDAAVAVPEMMGQVGRLGRILGPRGLMPNPRAGTVTPDVARAVSDIKGGKVEYRVDRHGNLHLILGKTSFDARALVENYQAVLDEILRAKPAAAKGRYIKGITVSTSMGPGIKIDPGATRNLLPAASA